MRHVLQHTAIEITTTCLINTNALTAFNLQRTDLPVHGKIREIHRTAGSHRQPVHDAQNINIIDLKILLSLLSRLILIGRSKK